MQDSATPAVGSDRRTTRRVFLGTASAAAMTAVSYARIQGANNRVNIAQVGYGLIGKQHIVDLKKFDDVNIVGLCEVYKPRLQEGLSVIGNPNCKGYSDFRKMFEEKDIQGVVVATPDHWHALLTIMACQAGKDVYVEKPLTVFNEEGKWMVQATKKYNRVVVVGTQRRHGKGVQAAKKVVDSGVIGKIHSVRIASYRNIYPGFGKTPVTTPPPELDYDMWLGPAEKKPYQAHRALYHFRWFWDYSGGQMTNLGAHTIDQVLWLMNVKGPTSVASMGSRLVLEDDGEVPDVQDAIFTFPGGWLMNYAIREANGLRGDTAARGQAYFGSKGTMVLAGNYEVIPEQKIDPVNDIPRFSGHPIGGPVYTDTKPTPWIQASKGGVESDARYGTGGEDTMAMNERNFIDCIRSRKEPLCGIEHGHRVAVTCNLANMSLRLGGRTIKWDPEKEVVIGDKEAAAMCVKQYRAPWDAALKSALGKA